MAIREYTIVVAGELSDDASSVFGGMALTRAGGNTQLTGPVSDQAELLALILRVYDLGLTLLSATAGAEAPRGRRRPLPPVP